MVSTFYHFKINIFASPIELFKYYFMSLAEDLYSKLLYTTASYCFSSHQISAAPPTVLVTVTILVEVERRGIVELKCHTLAFRPQ